MNVDWLRLWAWAAVLGYCVGCWYVVIRAVEWAA